MSESSCVCKESFLVGIGNPLLDISANVDEDLLKKYDLKPNNAIMAEEKHMPLYRELIEKYNAEFIAGGSVQNSLRVAQWILNRPRVCTYLGCVGNDDYARILKERAVADGVHVLYQTTSEAPTGTCAVLVSGTQRSLCANLAAARCFTADHLDTEHCQQSIQRASIFYTSGFFVAVSPESIMRLARHALDGNHTFVMNLSAPFVSEFYKDHLEQMLPYVDVLFGNETEAEAFATAFDFNETDLQEIAKKIVAMPKLGAKKRVVIITHGHLPVILAEGEDISLIHVSDLALDQIVDTNGAGDAFTGGCLAQMALEASYKTAVKCGIYAATHVIQHSGCVFSGNSQFENS